MRQSLLLLGRSGSGKTSVIETLSGSEVKNARDVQSFTRFGLEIKAKETFGFFSGKHDRKTCVKDLEECVCSFPGIDIIGFVIRIARFTPEEREMIENVRVTLGERAFGFTIVIFTNLDNLIYDDVPLSEFLEDSPQELNDLLSLCDGRYVGFNNKGSEEDRQGYARSLIEAMKTLQKKNKSAKYTVDLLEQARNAKLVKDEEKKKVEEENFRLVKEQMKHEISTEVEAKVRKELQDKRSAQDFIARQFTEDNEKRQQDCGDHGRRKLEDIRFDQDQGIRKQDGIRYCGDQERRKTDCMWYGEDQGTRKPDDMWCREDQGRSKPDGRWFGGNQARRKPDGMRCGGNQARRKPDGMRCGEDQGKRNPDGIQYGVVQGRKPDVMRYVEDEAQRTLENRCWPEDQMRRKPEVKQSTEDNGKIELEDKRCDEDIDKPAGEEGAFKARNKKTKPRPKTKPKPNLLMEENKKLAGGEGALKAGNKKPKTKPKPDHLKEKNKKLAVWVCTKCFEHNSNDVKTCKCGEDKRDTTKRVPGLPGDENSVPKVANPEGKLKKTPVTAAKKTLEACAEKTPEALAKETEGVNTGKKIAMIRPTIRYGVDERELRVVLIGKTGVGKSSTANTILGEDVFKAKASAKSVTEKCHFERSERFGKKILLVDTPGLLDTSTPKNVIENEIKKCIGISAPGPHAFIFVMSFTNRFTEEEQNVLNDIGDMFGDQMINYLIVLFTGRDQIDEGSIQQHIDEYPEEFRNLVQKAGGSYITFNNRGSLSEKEDDVQKLLNRINRMVKRNGGDHFTSEMFEAAEEVIKKRIANELAEKKEEIRKAVEEEIRKALEDEMRGKYDAEITRLNELREKDLLHYEVLKRKLKKEQVENRKNTINGNLKGALRPLIIDEMRANAEKKLIHQIETSEGPEKAEVHRQLAGAGQEIQQLFQQMRMNRAEEEISHNEDFEENASRAAEKYLVELRDKERGNIESEKGILQKIKEKLFGLFR